MPQEESETIAVTSGIKGRRGILDPADCEITVVVHDDTARVRIDGGADPVFWMEFPIPLKGTPAAET